MKKCRRCEGAADLVHFSSSAIKATAPQCSTLHPIVQSKRCGIKGSCRPPALGHLRLWESTAVSAPQAQHASYGCLTHACTMLSVCTQTAHARECINQRQHSDLDGRFLLWLHFFDHAKFRYTLHTKLSGGWGVSQIGLMNHATWYCLIECTKSKLDSHQRLLPSLPRQVLMKDNRLCINQRDGAFWSHSQLDYIT